MGVDLKLYNIELIDITEELSYNIMREWIDYLYEFQLLESNKNTKLKVFYHFFIKKVSDLIVDSSKDYKKILFITICNEKKCDIVLKNRISQANYEESEFFTMIKGLISKIERNFPIKFVVSTKSYKEYLDFLNKTPGKINYLRLKIEKSDFTKFTYSKILKFTKKYDLSWLNENYFNTIKSKLLLIS
jgi:hypothetical protein